jgi:arylsulfatase A-like enzyme
MFTGYYGAELNAGWREPLDGSRTTRAEAFSRQGYATLGVAGNQRYAGYESGLARGFAHYDDFMRTWRQVLFSTWVGQTSSVAQAAEAGSLRGAVAALARVNLWVDANRAMDERDAREVTDAFLDWEREGREGRPFFAFLNYFDAHEQVNPPSPYDTLFAAGGALPDLYDGAVRFIDDQVARLLRELERRGGRRTVVGVTADHGELLGEHGLVGHAHNLHARVLRVPLLVVADGVPAGTRVPTPVSLRDLAATLIDLAGVPMEAAFPGTTLRAAWRAGPALEASPLFSELPSAINPEPAWPIAKGPMVSLVAHGRHYIRLGDGSEQLFDVSQDDAETENLRDSTAESARLEELRASLGRVVRTLQAQPKPNESEHRR